VWRKRRDRGGRRRLFAWRMDRQPSAQVPLATSPEAVLREGAMPVGGGVGPIGGPAEGRPGEQMPAVYCSRCSRPNPDGARYCSNCGAPLARSSQDRGWGGGDRPGETTSVISPIAGEPDYGDEPSPDFSVVDSLPPGTALLVVQRGPNARSRFLRDYDFTSTGRHPDSAIFLDDVTVSRRHAEFYRTGDRFTVRDVGSLNGTYVNRERIEEAELFGGDEVQIGKFRLLFLTRSPEVGRRRGPGAQDYA